MMKKIYPIANEFDHEIEFCKNYSHRCFTPFYGFVRENNNIIGFIYKFMSNNTLHSYLKSKSDKFNKNLIHMPFNLIKISFIEILNLQIF